MMGSYDYRLVLLPLLIAFITSLVTFSLALRIYRSKPKSARLWLLGGAVAVGSGIWSMHMVSLLAFSLPVAVGYDLGLLALSWLLGVVLAGIAFKIFSQPGLSQRLLIIGGLVMGAGFWGTHYIDLYAMRMSPQITFEPLLVLLSVLIAVGSSMGVLFVALRLRSSIMAQPLKRQMLTACAMTAAIAIMHYTLMAATTFPQNALSTAPALSNPALLAISITLGALGLLISIFIFCLMDNRWALAHGLAGMDHGFSQMAMLDPLTQLPNRRYFQQHLEAGIRRTERLDNSLAIAFIDIDDFKPVNDVLGHHVGDEVLQLVAKRLNAAVRGCDLVARLGGDEFVAILEDIRSDQDIVPIAERIIHSLREVFVADDHEIVISASVGIAVYPRDGNLQKLLVSADAAMYRAKSDGKNQYRFYDSDIELASNRLFEIQRDLRGALGREEFKLHFQPKIDSKTHKLRGLEALLRWQHPTKGMVAPEVFIPAAESFGMINQIGEWVIIESCRTLQRMRNQGMEMTISINLSAHQLRDSYLVSTVQKNLRKFELPSSALMFELTEASAMQYPEQFNSLLHAFRSIGIEMAIDNFGTGYSSLSYLQKAQISEIKLDFAFFGEITSSPQTRAVLDAVIRLAHALGLTVVAEGVETEEQRHLLTGLGCNQLQGFHIARPVPEEGLFELIRKFASLEQSTPGLDQPPATPA